MRSRIPNLRICLPKEMRSGAVSWWIITTASISPKLQLRYQNTTRQLKLKSIKRNSYYISSNMGEPLLIPERKLNTELTEYSAVRTNNDGPYADGLEVDALIVGAGFGESPSTNKHFSGRRNKMNKD